MTKHLLLIALIPFCLSVSSAKLIFSEGDDEVTITGEGLHSEVEQFFSGGYYATYTKCDGAKITFSGKEAMLPYTSLNSISFYNGATIHFEDVMTLHYDETQSDEGPLLYVGNITEGSTGYLTLDFSQDAITNWLDAEGADPGEMVEHAIVSNCMFINNGSVTVNFGAVSPGNTFEYKGGTYTNKGLILDPSSLQAGDIAILYHLSGVDWNFSIVAVGTQDTPPVPEPTTGTLSLLALAALAARRRRK